MFRNTLKEKMVPKQCSLGTILKNCAFFDKKGTILVLLMHQNKEVWENSALLESDLLKCPPPTTLSRRIARIKTEFHFKFAALALQFN